MSNNASSEVSGGCTSVEDGVLACSPWSNLEDSKTLVGMKLGHRTRRHGHPDTTLANRKRRITASDTRRIRVIGRFASPTCSREGSPEWSVYDSSDSDDPCPPTLNSPIDVRTAKKDPNDADDEAEVDKDLKMRGRSRGVRCISVSRE